MSIEATLTDIIVQSDVGILFLHDVSNFRKIQQLCIIGIILSYKYIRISYEMQLIHG